MSLLWMHKITDEGWDTESCNSGAKVVVWMQKNTNEGWDKERLAILVLKSLFSMQKTIGEVWDP